MKNNYYVWIEIQANKNLICKRDNFRNAMEKCMRSGIGSVILSVKDTTGFTLFESAYAPHYSLYDPVFNGLDYLAECLGIIHSLGMKCYAAFDVFAEGNKKNPHLLMPGLKNEGWMTEVYGLNEEDKPVIQKVAASSTLHTIGSIDDFGEIFVNPANSETCTYECDLIREVIDKYPIDGVVLDRVRYVGLSSDFSPLTKQKFLEYSKITDMQWPEDIYTMKRTENDIQLQHGRYFGSFLEFRALTISIFMKKVRNVINECNRKVELLDYTGSWYPLYYQVGANWASENYVPTEYPWVDPVKYSATGYIGHTDKLLSGFYYEDVTKEQAVRHGKPADWYSVEGSAEMAYKVTRREKPVIGSLFLQQYADSLNSMKEAVAMCFEKSDGCMLFDLSYLEENNWWKYIKIEN
ncbi:MAG: family 10 glycosylhydrolase [Clostridiales bacterium]|nr:family 10 glycosylhydrolase [Clostridiales bacterium]